jgi:hypothetical protein
VLGIVVAHSRLSSLTWILPANEIFTDIKSRWEAQGMHIYDLTEASAGKLSPEYPIEHHRDHEASAGHMDFSANRRANSASTSNSVDNLAIKSSSDSDDATAAKLGSKSSLDRSDQVIAFRQVESQEGIPNPLAVATGATFTISSFVFVSWIILRILFHLLSLTQRPFARPGVLTILNYSVRIPSDLEVTIYCGLLWIASQLVDPCYIFLTRWIGSISDRLKPLPSIVGD